jgi:hypothetical protein
MLQSWPVRYHRMLAQGLEPQITKVGGGRYRVSGHSNRLKTKKMPTYMFFIPAVLALLVFAFWPSGKNQVSAIPSPTVPAQKAQTGCTSEAIEATLTSQSTLNSSLNLTENKSQQLGGFRSRLITVECEGKTFAFALTEFLADKKWRLKKLTRLEN